MLSNFRLAKRLLPALLIVSVCAPLSARDFTDEEIKQRIAKAPTAEQHPQAGAYILIDLVDVKVNADRSIVTDYLKVVKLFQDRARSDYADIKQQYNKDVDSVVVVKAVTHLADGTEVPVEAKAIHDLTPAALANAAVYSNIMQKVVSFPAIAPGVTVELRLRKFTQAPEPEEEMFVSGVGLFQGTEPIGYKAMSVTLPVGMSLQYTYQNEGIDYSTSSAEGFVTHAWKNEFVPQIIEEPAMPSLSRIAPRLIYTTADSWDQVAEWAAKKFFSRVVTDGAIAKKANDLTKKARTPDEKIEAISLYVIKEIRNVAEHSLPLGLAGYEPHDADQVLANKYGDWRDKAVLLVSLLRAAGIDARPHLVDRKALPLAGDHPTLKQFDAIYVYLPAYRGAPLWINPFGSAASFGYYPSGQGGTGLLLSESGGELLEVADTRAEDNLSDCRFELTVLPNGNVDGEIACHLTGIFDHWARGTLKDATPAEREKIFHTTANTLGEGTVSRSFKVSDLQNLLAPAQVAQEYLSPEMGIVQGDMMIFYVPDLPFSFANFPASPSQPMRTYDFILGHEMTLRREGVVYLPAGFRPVFIADPVRIANQFGIWESSLTLNADSTVVSYQTIVELRDDEIDTDEYLEFKSASDRFTAPRNSLILLERKDSQSQ